MHVPLVEWYDSYRRLLFHPKPQPANAFFSSDVPANALGFTRAAISRESP
jgi:hypothetical protein